MGVHAGKILYIAKKVGKNKKAIYKITFNDYLEREQGIKTLKCSKKFAPIIIIG